MLQNNTLPQLLLTGDRIHFDTMSTVSCRESPTSLECCNRWTAFSCAVVAGGALCCLLLTCWRPKHAEHVGFTIVAVTATLGAWKWWRSAEADSLKRLHNYSFQFQKIFGLPCIMASLWATNHYRWSVQWTWSGMGAALSILPSMFYSDGVRGLVNHVAAAFQLLALGAACFFSDNPLGVAAAAAYFAALLCLWHGRRLRLPPMDSFNYCLCLFLMFAVKSILRVKEVPQDWDDR